MSDGRRYIPSGPGYVEGVSPADQPESYSAMCVQGIIHRHNAEVAHFEKEVAQGRTTTASYAVRICALQEEIQKLIARIRELEALLAAGGHPPVDHCDDDPNDSQIPEPDIDDAGADEEASHEETEDEETEDAGSDEETVAEIVIDPDMIWAVQTGPDEVCVYLGESDTANFTFKAAELLCAALKRLLDQHKVTLAIDLAGE